LTENLEAPVFDKVAFTSPPPLSEATVAIVTTAALHHPNQEDFSPMDSGFRILYGNRRDYRLGHWSPNFDTMGFAGDFNTVIPLDRLDELVADGKIGQVSDTHLSYAGNQFDLSGIRLDSGPAGAKLLKEKGVGIVLFTPV
jgi:D-proline reductase (dithiol) PrdB